MHLCPVLHAPSPQLARKSAVPAWKKPRRVSPANILQLVREILDRREPAAVRWLRALWAEQAASITDDVIRAALAAGSIPADVLERFAAGYHKLMNEQIRQACISAAAEAGALVADAVGMTLRPGTGAAIVGRLGRLPVELTTQQRQALDVLIRYYTTTAQAPVGTVAADVRRFIGLTSREAQAVVNLRERLVADEATPAQIDRAVTNYTSHLRQARALRIARTDLAFATSQGQRDAILQAQREGYVGPDVRREWSAAEDEVTCPVCGELDGQAAALGEAFEGGIDDPPAHPNCRCVVVYVDLVPKE